MRRRNVPCSPCGSGSSSGCGCCSLKEKLAVLWDRTIGSILKINNVTPDGEGKFEIKAGSNVSISEISNGIEISATGGSAEDVVKSVNGELPDQDGDVTVDTGVMTVNGVSPDADGEVTITAGSNITITPDAGTNSIEISAEGGSPEAVAPIYIDGDGKIAIKGWELVTFTDWSVFRNANGEATEDLLLYIWGTYSSDDIFIPKGVKISNLQLNSAQGTGSNIYVSALAWNASYPFNNGTTVQMTAIATGTSTSGSGANQIFMITTGTVNENLNKITSPSSTSPGVRLFRRAV